MNYHSKNTDFPRADQPSTGSTVHLSGHDAVAMNPEPPPPPRPLSWWEKQAGNAATEDRWRWGPEHPHHRRSALTETCLTRCGQISQPSQETESSIYLWKNNCQEFLTPSEFSFCFPSWVSRTLFSLWAVFHLAARALPAVSQAQPVGRVLAQCVFAGPLSQARRWVVGTSSDPPTALS